MNFYPYSFVPHFLTYVFVRIDKKFALCANHIRPSVRPSIRASVHPSVLVKGCRRLT